MDRFKIRQFDLTSETSNNLQSGQKNQVMPSDKNNENRFNDDWNQAIDNQVEEFSTSIQQPSGHHARHSSLPNYIMQGDNVPDSIHVISEDAFYGKYEELETLGEGGAAVVKKCRHLEEDKLYAAKIMRNRDIEKEQASRAEFELLDGLEQHKHIIGAKEFISTVSNTYTIMENAEGVELQDYLERQGSEFPDNAQLKITLKII